MTQQLGHAIGRRMLGTNWQDGEATTRTIQTRINRSSKTSFSIAFELRHKCSYPGFIRNICITLMEWYKTMCSRGHPHVQAQLATSAWPMIGEVDKQACVSRPGDGCMFEVRSSSSESFTDIVDLAIGSCNCAAGLLRRIFQLSHQRKRR